MSVKYIAMTACIGHREAGPKNITSLGIVQYSLDYGDHGEFKLSLQTHVYMLHDALQL